MLVIKPPESELAEAASIYGLTDYPRSMTITGTWANGTKVTADQPDQLDIEVEMVAGIKVKPVNPIWIWLRQNDREAQAAAAWDQQNA